MATTLCGLELAHPVLNGSGTFDVLAAHEVFGDALLARFPFSAYVSKTITLAARHGNPPPRLWEAPAGMINSIGLPNKGLERYVAEDLPRYRELLPVPLITNVMGATAPELVALVEALDDEDGVAAVELNVSCPNVHTGLDLGADGESLAAVLREVRPRTSKPLIVKLTPNTADVALVAQAAESEGADAVSLINTLRAMAPHPDGSGRPWLGGRTGGLSGPAVRAVALAQVAAVAGRVSIDVVGMGGVSTAVHARSLLTAGARAVAVGTASFIDPAAGALVAEGLRDLAL